MGKFFLQAAAAGILAAVGYEYVPRFVPAAADVAGLPVRRYGGALVGGAVGLALTGGLPKKS